MFTTLGVVGLVFAAVALVVLALDMLERRRRRSERVIVRRIVQYLEMTRPRSW